MYCLSSRWTTHAHSVKHIYSICGVWDLYVSGRDLYVTTSRVTMAWRIYGRIIYNNSHHDHDLHDYSIQHVHSYPSDDTTSFCLLIDIIYNTMSDTDSDNYIIFVTVWVRSEKTIKQH